MSEAMNAHQDRFRRLADTILRLMPGDGALPLGESGVSVIRSSGATPTVHYGVEGDLGPATCKVSPLTDGKYRIPIIAP